MRVFFKSTFFAQAALVGICSTFLFGFSSNAQTGFDWGNDCGAGDGEFTQAIEQDDTVLVGFIPKGKLDVRVDLQSSRDVDIQLVNALTGERIIHWPYGLLNGPDEACAEYQGNNYCYSGYNGDGQNLGHEWIRVEGVTATDVEMRAFGYEGGTAAVRYSYEAQPSCNEQGSGSFEQYIGQEGVTVIGTIPAGKVDVDIQLSAANDLDIQLYAGPIAIVQWPNGTLNGPDEQMIDFQGMQIGWSGYNGNDDGPGNEYIRIRGTISRDLVMKAYGYEAGIAKVDYAWGMNSGNMCGGIAGFQCANGWTCKGMADYPDASGVCHLRDWCSDESVESDCAIYAENMRLVEGTWSCEDYKCVHTPVVNRTCQAPSSYEAVSADFISDPTEFTGLNIQLTGKLEQGPTYCTLQACPLDNPCCNSCGSSFKLDTLGGSVELEGVNCGGNNCTVNDNCPYNDGETVTVWGQGASTNAYPILSVDDTCLILGFEACGNNGDCLHGEFCASDGFCRANGTCTQRSDCANEANNWNLSDVFCIATTTRVQACNVEGMCEVQCVPLQLPTCVDVTGTYFGACEMLLGWAYQDGSCKPISGCSANGMVMHPTEALCNQLCEAP